MPRYKILFIIVIVFSSDAFSGYWLIGQSGHINNGTPTDFCGYYAGLIPVEYFSFNDLGNDSYQCLNWVDGGDPCEDEDVNTEWNQEDFVCEPPIPPPPECEVPSGTKINRTFAASVSTKICSSNCQWNMEGVTVVTSDGIGFGTFVTNGQTCDGSEGGNGPGDPPDDDPDDGCPAGFSATDNGCAPITPQCLTLIHRCHVLLFILPIPTVIAGMTQRERRVV